jgi:short-subunit dehydrogenase
MASNGKGKFAIVTGASSGIGLELAKCCARDGYDLLIAADDPKIEEVAGQIGMHDSAVESVLVDLSTTEGVDKMLAANKGRKVDVLIANAGHGLGKGFLDQNFDEAQHVINTNISGTLYLIHKVGNEMRSQGGGRILITGSIAGFMPGSFQAVYNGSKAFIDSFAAALRNELKDTGITVTCLMPGATETEFFERADLMDTKIGQQKKDDPAEVAQQGYDAMVKGDAGVIAGSWGNTFQVAMSRVMSSEHMAEQHRKEAAPGTAKDA